jgi:hypothetical protein
VAQPATRDERLSGRLLFEREEVKHLGKQRLLELWLSNRVTPTFDAGGRFPVRQGCRGVRQHSSTIDTTFSWHKGAVQCADCSLIGNLMTS